MIEHEMEAPVAILAVLRRDESVRGVAERLGVTEAEVEKWKDIFVVAGTLALSKTRGARRSLAAGLDARVVGSFYSCSGDPTPHPSPPPSSSRDAACSGQYSSDPPTTLPPHGGSTFDPAE